MFNRQKIYIGLAVSAGVCTTVGLYLLYRQQKQISLSKTSRCLTPISTLPSSPSRHDYPSIDIDSPIDVDNDESDSALTPNKIHIPSGSVPLTPDQASILTHFLYESHDNEEQLHYGLKSIANTSVFKESQINLANAGCIARLRELLLTSDNDTTKCHILLALNNLALNDFAITQFSNIVSIVINLCRNSPSSSSIRLYGLSLLINMSVLDYLHEEYMSNVCDLGLLIESTIVSDDEALSSGKVLVNLSVNSSNLENLLKLTGLELKLIVNLFTSRIDQSKKSEDILIRFLIFYCNVAERILSEIQNEGDANNNTSWLTNPTPQRRGALYFEFFDQDKQMLAKSLLRPHYTSTLVNSHMK
ncbi:unnamed protein product, partial [Adineta ricciae]